MSTMSETTNLLCIGGPNDGIIVEMPHGEVSILLTAPVSSSGSDPVLPDKIVDDDKTVYTRRIILYKGGTENVEYLAPIDMSDPDAIKHLLSRHAERA